MSLGFYLFIFIVYGVELVYNALVSGIQKVNQLYVCIYPLFFGFPSNLGHHRALSIVP